MIPIRSSEHLFSDVLDEQIFAVVEFGADALPQGSALTDLKNQFWVQAWKWGTWDHPRYGQEKIDQQFAEQLIANFRENTFGQELPFDYEHGEDPSKGLQAAAWVRDMDIRVDGIYYLLEFTDDALGEIRAGKWRYISPGYFSNWKDDATGTVHTNVPTGGGITNRPYFKGMLPLNFSELVGQTENIADALKQFSEEWASEYRRLLAEIEKERKGGNDNMTEEMFRKFCEILGIELPKEFTEEVVLAKATELNDVIQPLREAKVKAENNRTFRETFPEEYDRMIRLEAAQLTTDAKEFASRYERFTVKGVDGKPDTKEDRGFSALALEKIEEAHKEFTAGKATPETLKSVLDTISSGGIVDYKEYGSSRAGETTYLPNDMNDVADVRRAFGELVNSFMEDDNMTYDKAVSLAAQKEPELFSAYQSKMPQA